MDNEGTIIQGARVSLRAPLPGDADEFTCSALESREFHGDLVAPASDAEAFDAYVERYSSEANRAFLIIERASGRIAGAVNLSQIFHGPLCSAYLGYYLFEGFTGKGLMAEALRLVLEYSFDNLGLHRLEANIQPHNTSSIALVKRCGFTREGFSRKYLKIAGEWRDHERWAIIKEDLTGTDH